MENGHRMRLRSDDEGEIADEESPSELDEEAPKSSSPVSVVMPCTSTTDAVGNPTVYDELLILDSSDEVYCTDDGDEADDDDTSDDQQRDLTVTFRSEETNEEIATATLIVKRHDPVDTFLPFVGALLRSIQSEQMKLRLMEDISQILINAKTEEIQSYRRPRLQ